MRMMEIKAGNKIDFYEKDDCTFYVKKFSELTSEELYEILKIRAAVFVVEQNCVYQDLDDIDYEAYHIFIRRQNLLSGKDDILAYLRIYEKCGIPEGSFHSLTGKIVQIGRVLTMDRGKGLGMSVLLAGIEAAQKDMNADILYLEAQSYAVGFYKKAGFIVNSEEFQEDGIPHVQMIRKAEEEKECSEKQR